MSEMAAALVRCAAGEHEILPKPSVPTKPVTPYNHQTNHARMSARDDDDENKEEEERRTLVKATVAQYWLHC